MNNTRKVYKKSQNYYGAIQHKNTTVTGIIFALPCQLRSSVTV